jgi:hypothetical protein
VTEVQGDTFIFMKTQNSSAWVKKYLSSSPIQKSQLYNFVRGKGYELLAGRSVVDARITATDVACGDPRETVTYEETLYNQLLETFARNLRKSGVRFLMIAVNGQLSRFPAIQLKIAELHEQDLLEYVEVIPWFEKGVDYASPEGHSWGAKAHAVLGQHLAEIIRTEGSAMPTH